jgi:para-nitrobenzyl esterase
MTTVETTLGSVAGSVRDDVHVFKAIPYAAPPVGPLRFRAPQPAAPWAGTRDATHYGPVAPQTPSPMETMFGGPEPVQSEADCLTLNVFTPAPDGARRPVMVWIHGGAFVNGSGATPWYDGTAFARNGDVVLVTINYRLGALGFLHLDELSDAFAGTGSGNVGILDQVAALEWVRDNAEAFGGDPNNVTAFGESAGAMSVGTLLGLPAAKGLFVKAIPQSGAAHHARPTDVATDVARKFLAEAGLSADADGVAQLQELPIETLMAAQASLLPKTAASGGLAFAPVVDGIVLPERPIDAIGGGSAADVAVLIGTTRDEMKLFTMLDPGMADLDDAKMLRRANAILGDETKAAGLLAAYKASRPELSPGDLWNVMSTDHVFRIPAVRLAERQSGLGNRVYMYRFDWATPVFGGALGACHALEIPFVFDNLDAAGSEMFTGTASDEMRAMARTMHTAWHTFARSGQPGDNWPTYTAAQRNVMRFDLTSEVVEDPEGAEREAWEGLL